VVAAITRTIRAAPGSERPIGGYRAVFIADGGARSPATGTSAHLVRAVAGLRGDYPADAIDSSALDSSALDSSALDS
jgi:hypothetical protein